MLIPITDYSLWTEDQLFHEVTRRKLAHGINERSFPEESRRCARLIEILQEYDRFSGGTYHVRA